MAGWDQECESAEQLAEESAHELLGLNPQHELLKYWFITEEDIDSPTGKVDPKKEKVNKKEMKDRFWNKNEPWEDQPGVKVTAIVTTNYYIALKEAIENQNGTS